MNDNAYKIISDFNDVSYFAKTSVEEMSAQGILKKDVNNKFNSKKYIKIKTWIWYILAC